MLALSRSARAVHKFSHHVRALSAVAPSTASPEIAGAGQPDVDNSRARHKQEKHTKYGREGVFVHPWDGIRSSAEGLAIARAVQDKYGRAKEILFSQDPEDVTVFHPYFWIVFKDPEVRKRLPKEAQIRVRVPDLQRRDGNVGIEDMLRALGLSPTSIDTYTPREPESPSATEGTSTDTSDNNDGYKTLDVRVMWSRVMDAGGPNLRIHPPAFHRHPERLSDFAAAWLAFDGFSPESARGPHTPNLLRARKKWQDFAVKAGSSAHHDDLTTTSPTTESSPEIGKAAARPLGPREWIPILPYSSRVHHPDRSTTTATSPRTGLDHATLTSSDDHLAAPNAAPSIVTATPDPDLADASTSTSTPMPTTATSSSSTGTISNDEAQSSSRDPKPSSHNPRSRRERILHLARQNARTPLPERLVETFEKEKDQSGARNGDEQKLEAEAEQKGKERTIRERLWRLVGGNY